MQQINLRLDHGNFFCAATGKQILGPETIKPSPATAFIFLDATSQFAHTSDYLREYQTPMDNGAAFSNESQFHEAIKGMKTLVVFSVTVNNGDFSPAVRVGIDMNYVEE
jgi:hypothetical protein